MRPLRGFSPDLEQMLLAEDWIEKHVKHKVSCSLASPNIRTMIAGGGLPEIALSNQKGKGHIRELSRSYMGGDKKSFGKASGVKDLLDITELDVTIPMAKEM